MSNRFNLKKIPPHYNSNAAISGTAAGNSVMALDIRTKLQFLSEDGSVYHEYEFPSDRDIQNCGGYIDKLMKYRSEPVRDEVASMFAPDVTAPEAPVLKGRSILVDILLTKMIDRFITTHDGARAKLFDHGCTVAEHYEMLDQMLTAYCGRSAPESFSYYGLDVSPLALCGARMLHPKAPPSDFHLILAEGSDISPPTNSMDFSMSIGVVNHVQDPLHALDRLLDITRYGTVLVLWITGEPQGFWAINHSGFPNYFLSVKDLNVLAKRYANKGSFHYADFIPEKSSTQTSSYLGISDERLELLGSYTLVFCGKDYVVDGTNPIDFGEK